MEPTVNDSSYGGGISVGILVVIIIFLIYISMMVWVYKDARQRNMEPVLWVILICFFNCCGLIIYLISRSEHPVGTQGEIYGSSGPQMDSVQYGQPQYGQPQHTQTQTPPSPKPQKTRQKTKFCRYCGGEMPNTAKFCSICGANEFDD